MSPNNNIDTTKYSKIYRIIHWTMALLFMLILLTIFLRSTWMSKSNMAAIMQNYLQDANINLSQDQLAGMAKKIRQPMWVWHIYIGYALVGLFSIRFMLPAFGYMKIQNPLNKNLSTKMKIQKWTYLIFYFFVIISLFTGLMIELGPNQFRKPMEKIHVLSIYYLITYIIIHLAGVLRAEFTDQNGIISKIISGHKKENESLN